MPDIFQQFYDSTSFSTYSGGDGSVDLEWLTSLFPKGYLDAPAIPLKPQASVSWAKTDIRDILRSRRSRRRYSDAKLTFDLLSTLLLSAAGTTGNMHAYGYHNYPLRSFPSGGGLQSTEIYVAIKEGRVTSIDPGLYHYNAVYPCLEKIGGDEESAKVDLALRSQPWYIDSAPVILVFTVDYARLSRKYGNRAARLALLDPGFAAENILLVAEALGLAAVAVCGINEDLLFEALKLSPTDDEEYPVMLLPIGYPVTG